MKSVVFCILFLFSVKTTAQNRSVGNFEYQLKLKSVSFWDDLPIVKDDDSGAYSRPQWTSTNQQPVAYISGKHANVSAEIEILLCKNDLNKVKVDVRGTIVTDKFASTLPIISTEIQNGINGNFLINYTKNGFTNLFPQGIVGYYKNLKIIWEISFNNEKTWQNAGESQNTIYVTHKTPLAEISTKGYKWFHSLFDISCRNAKDKSEVKQIWNSIWDDIKDRNVIKVDGKQIKYYEEFNDFGCHSTNTAALFLDNDGQCGSWAHLSIDLLKIHGFGSETTNYVTLEGKSYDQLITAPASFLVKNWEFQGNKQEYENVPKFPLIQNNAYNWLIEDVKDLTGLEGQGTQNPNSLFGNHQIIKFLPDNSFYDPSYGSGPYLDTGTKLLDVMESNYENDNIAGFYLLFVISFNEIFRDIDINGDGIKESLVFVDAYSITKNFLTIPELTRRIFPNY